MRLFNHKVFVDNGIYSSVEMGMLEKRFISAKVCMAAIQQGFKEQELEDCVRDLVCGLTNREITIHERRSWNSSTNLETWAFLFVDLDNRTAEESRKCYPPANSGRYYYVTVPKSLITDELRAELYAPKPKWFNPTANKYSLSYIRHLQVCHEHQICIECGRKEEDLSYPYCSIHNPYFKVEQPINHYEI